MVSKHSAVVVLHEQASNSFVLTKRSLHLADHPGEICFPGGRWEANDPSLWFTALRELGEELGIDHSRVKLIKKLKPETTLNGIIIHPWLASLPTLNPLKVNETEVSEVLLLPFMEVKKTENYKEIMVQKNGINIKSCQYVESTHFIWGATARIMRQLTRIK